MHRNAPLTPEGRLRLCHRIGSGWSVAAAAESMNISRQTASKWWGRYLREGIPGLADRSSRPRRSPQQTPGVTERQILHLRRDRKLGPARIGGILGIPASTVHRVLVRHRCNRLRWMDRPTGRVIRRIETSRCGELVHIDVKKLARIPAGGGHRMLGQVAGRPHQQDGTGVCPYPLGHRRLFATCLFRIRRSRERPDVRGVSRTRETVPCRLRHRDRADLTDNGVGYRSTRRDSAVANWASPTPTQSPTTRRPTAKQSATTARCWTNGPIKRFYGSEAERARTLDGFVHAYNHHRYHTAVGGPPISRVNNVSGDHS